MPAPIHVLLSRNWSCICAFFSRLTAMLLASGPHTTQLIASIALELQWEELTHSKFCDSQIPNNGFENVWNCSSLTNQSCLQHLRISASCEARHNLAAFHSPHVSCCLAKSWLFGDTWSLHDMRHWHQRFIKKWNNVKRQLPSLHGDLDGMDILRWFRA